MSRPNFIRSAALVLLLAMITASTVHAQPALRCINGFFNFDHRMDRIVDFAGTFNDFNIAHLSYLTFGAGPHPGGGRLVIDKVGETRGPDFGSVDGFTFSYQGTISGRWTAIDDLGFSYYESIYRFKYNISFDIQWLIFADGRIVPLLLNRTLTNPDNEIRRIRNSGVDELVYAWTPFTNFSICEEVPAQSGLEDPAPAGNYALHVDATGFSNPDEFAQLRLTLGGDTLDSPTGDFEFSLMSDAQLAIDPGDPMVNQGVARLYRTSGFLRPQGPMESRTDYRARVRDSFVEQIGPSIDIAPPSMDTIMFPDVPLFHVSRISGSSAPQVALYAVEVSNARVEEFDLNTPELTDRITTYYSRGFLANLVPTDPVIDRDVLLTPLDGLAAKRDLAEQIKKLSVTRYGATEDGVITYIDGLLSATPTAENVEGVRRALWAERAVRDGTLFAKDLIDVMLDGFSDLITNFMEELFSAYGTSKRVAEENASLDQLKSARGEALTSQGWSSLGPGSDFTLTQQSIENLLKDNNSVRTRFLVGNVKKAFKYALAGVRVLVKDNLDGATEDDVLLTVDLLQAALFGMFDLILTEGAGTVENAAKLAVAAIINSQKDNLYDTNDNLSFAATVAPMLACTDELMQAWSTDNPSAYVTDRDAAVTEIRLLGDRASIALRTAIKAKAIGEAADVIENLSEFVKGNPYGRAIFIAAKVTKFLSNGVNFGAPAYVLLRLPSDVEKAVLAAMNNGPCPAPAPRKSTTRQQKIAGAFNGLLDSPVFIAATDLSTVLTELSTQLAANEIPAVVDAAGANTPNFADAATELAQTLALFKLQIDEIDPPTDASIAAATGLNQRATDLLEATADLSGQLAALLFQVYQLGYNGPTDPLYLADRNALLGQIAGFRDSLTALTDEVTRLSNDFAAATVLPVIAVESLTLSSDATGERSITSSPEAFTLSARVRNLSTQPLSNVGAGLTLTSLRGSTALDTAAQVNAGTLTADDGMPGGSDEAELSWQMTYAGDLNLPERITLLVSPEESGAAPTSFVSDDGFELLTQSAALIDGDFDGIPIHYERDHGLDPGIADGEGDKDADGLSNRREFELGTKASVADTDADELLDGEEVIAGADGFITDPLLADTDGDETDDSDDGHPLDGTTTEAPTSVSEPIIAVDTKAVTLDSANRIAIVAVSNAGTGNFNWSARSRRPSIAIASPNVSNVKGGEGTLIITVPQGFDFSAGNGLSTQVEVIDVTGFVRDSQFVTVSIGTGPPPNYTLGIAFSGTGSGEVNSVDGGIACGGDCSQSYALGSMVTLNVSPVGGSAFVGWSGSGDCTTGILVINGNTSCVAGFTNTDVLFKNSFE